MSAKERPTADGPPGRASSNHAGDTKEVAVEIEPLFSSLGIVQRNPRSRCIEFEPQHGTPIDRVAVGGDCQDCQPGEPTRYLLKLIVEAWCEVHKLCTLSANRLRERGDGGERVARCSDLPPTDVALQGIAELRRRTLRRRQTRPMDDHHLDGGPSSAGEPAFELDDLSQELHLKFQGDRCRGPGVECAYEPRQAHNDEGGGDEAHHVHSPPRART